MPKCAAWCQLPPPSFTLPIKPMLVSGEPPAGENQGKTTLSIRNVSNHAVDHGISASDERLLN
jgi:hypothetical protein